MTGRRLTVVSDKTSNQDCSSSAVSASRAVHSESLHDAAKSSMLCVLSYPCPWQLPPNYNPAQTTPSSLFRVRFLVIRGGSMYLPTATPAFRRGSMLSHVRCTDTVQQHTLQETASQNTPVHLQTAPTHDKTKYRTQESTRQTKIQISGYLTLLTQAIARSPKQHAGKSHSSIF